MAVTVARARSTPAGALKGYRRFLALYLPLGLAVIVTLFPFYWMFITSIKSNRELYDLNAPQFLVTQPTLEHYIYLLTQTRFLKWATNPLIITVSSTTISLLCGILA